MIWGGRYSGHQHYGVTVIHLQSVITSCTQAGNEMNQFAPNTSVYVKGSWLEATTEYKIWLQDDPVSGGDLLISGEDDSGPQETVTTDGSGNFSPTEIWPIPESEPVTHHPYDIVVDKVGDGEGTYSSTNDGIDSISAAGIVAPIPEEQTLVLFSIGVLMLAGYVIVRRRYS